MKKYLNYLVLACALATFPLTTAMTCTQSQQRTTYTTLYGIGSAVNSAYAAYNDQVVKGKALLNPSIAKAYNDFQIAFSVAITAAQNNSSVPASTNLINQGNAVITAIANR